MEFVRRALLRSKESLSQDFAAQVEDYYRQYTPAETRLVLDSIGLRTTGHYLVLTKIGKERLLASKEIHCFSGGVFAYFAFQGALDGHLMKDISEYFRGFDKPLRRTHHGSFAESARMWYALLTKRRDLVSTSALERIIDLIMSPTITDAPLASLPANFIPYVAVRGSNLPMNARDVLPPDATVRDLLVAAMRVPLFYGLPEGERAPYDAAFCRGYAKKLRDFATDEVPTLVSTPWKSGRKGKATFINCYGTPNAKRAALLDASLFVCNLPNLVYEVDLEVSFRDFAKKA